MTSAANNLGLVCAVSSLCTSVCMQLCRADVLTWLVVVTTSTVCHGFTSVCLPLSPRLCVLFLCAPLNRNVIRSTEGSVSFSGSQADLNCNIQDDTGSFYGVTSQYESSENMTITCSTKVCSFGKQVVEKVEVRTQAAPPRESDQYRCCVLVYCIALYCTWIFVFVPQTEYARFENGRFVYRISRSPMCEYMINFIHKLKHLPEKYMMNSVLENFTILLVITSLTWVGEIPLQDSHSSSLCCEAVLMAAVGLVRKKKKRGVGVERGVTGPWDLEMSSSFWYCYIALIPQGMKHSVRSLIICRGKRRIREGRDPCY